MDTQTQDYAARLEIDYSDRLDRVSSVFRLIWIIPIAIVLGVLMSNATSTWTVVNQAGDTVSQVSQTGGGIIGGLFGATLLMILFRQRYPRWWFDFARELYPFSTRVGAYAALLTDRYPSTVDEQAVHLEIDYPNVEKDLNRWLPLVKWLLAIPHYIVLFFLGGCGIFAVMIAWFAILFTGKYPQGLFNSLWALPAGRFACRPTSLCW